MYLIYQCIKEKAQTKKEYIGKITETLMYVARKVIDKK